MFREKAWGAVHPTGVEVEVRALNITQVLPLRPQQTMSPFTSFCAQGHCHALGLSH